MEKRTFGKTGLNVSLLGFGGAEIGFEHATPDAVDRLLSSALEAGMNVIDTGECYGNSEELIGNAVGHRRDDYHLFTKCGHSAGFDLPDWDINLLERSIERSLQRLKTDCVDLVLLHSCGEDLLRQGDVIAVLQRARDAGKTRFIGYSGDSHAARYAIECGAFDALETSVNIADQEALELTLPLAQERGVGIIAKRPIANAAWLNGAPEDNYGHTYWKRLNDLQYPFLQGDAAVKTALRFTVAAPIHTAIMGTKRPERWTQNAALIADGPLPREEFEAIRARWQEVATPNWTGQT